MIKTKVHSTLGGKQKTFNFIQNNKKHSFDGGNVTKTKTKVVYKLEALWKDYQNQNHSLRRKQKTIQTLTIKLNLWHKNLQNQNHSLGGIQWSRMLWLGNYGEARVNARTRGQKRTHWHRTKGDTDYKYTWRGVGNRWTQLGIREDNQTGDTWGRASNLKTSCYFKIKQEMTRQRNPTK